METIKSLFAGKSPHAGTALLVPAGIGSTRTIRASEKIRKANLHVCDLNRYLFSYLIRHSLGDC